MNPVLRHPDVIAEGPLRIAREEDLRAARAVIADMTSHPDQAVIGAARTILKLSPDEEHYQEAFKVLRMLDQLEQIP